MLDIARQSANVIDMRGDWLPILMTCLVIGLIGSGIFLLIERWRYRIGVWLLVAAVFLLLP